jgi:acyl carrier protein
MTDVTTRLIQCFQVVFPDLPESRILTATPASVAEWDSVHTISLIHVVEDEFGVEVDLEMLMELSSFEKIRDYIEGCLAGSGS